MAVQNQMWSAAMHYVLFYEVRNDYVEKRAQFRELHLKLARAAAHDRGELMRRDMVRRPPDRSAGSRGRLVVIVFVRWT
jgi:hypothetical protein